MKNTKQNIFVIHSLNGDTLEFWGKDIKTTFENKLEIIMPQFPIRSESRYEKFERILSKYLMSNKLNKDSIVICHSIGNPYFIRFCKEMNFIPKSYIAVAPGAVYEYSSTRNDYIVAVKKQAYLTADSLEFVKSNLQNKYCFYSDEDDNNPEKFTRFIKDTGCNSVYLKGYNHFDGRHRIYKIPELIELIEKLRIM